MNTCEQNETPQTLKRSLKDVIQWNLYITKSSVQRTISLPQSMVKYMEKNLDITKPCYNEHILPVLGPSLYRGFTVLSASPYFIAGILRFHWNKQIK